MQAQPAGGEQGHSAVSVGLLVACLSCAAAAGAVALGLHPAVGIGAPVIGTLVCAFLLWRGRGRV